MATLFGFNPQMRNVWCMCVGRRCHVRPTRSVVGVAAAACTSCRPSSSVLQNEYLRFVPVMFEIRTCPFMFSFYLNTIDVGEVCN